MLRSRVLILLGVYMSSYALFQHVNRTLNRNTLYDVDEPFEAKDYHTALIIGYRWFNYSDRKWFVNHKSCIMRYVNLSRS